jgi:hypothetical protein
MKDTFTGFDDRFYVRQKQVLDMIEGLLETARSALEKYEAGELEDVVASLENYASVLEALASAADEALDDTETKVWYLLYGNEDADDYVRLEEKEVE